MTRIVLDTVAATAVQTAGEDPFPVWVTVVTIAVVLLGGVAATRTTGSPHPGPAGRRSSPPEPLGHPLDRIDPI